MAACTQAFTRQRSPSGVEAGPDPPAPPAGPDPPDPPAPVLRSATRSAPWSSRYTTSRTAAACGLVAAGSRRARSCAASSTSLRKCASLASGERSRGSVGSRNVLPPRNARRFEEGAPRDSPAEKAGGQAPTFPGPPLGTREARLQRHLHPRPLARQDGVGGRVADARAVGRRRVGAQDP